MKPQRTFLATLLLVAWLFAGAHMALEHGGAMSVCRDVPAHHDGEDDHDSTGGHHCHDLGAVRAEKTITAQKMALAAPLWTPRFDELLAQFVAQLRRAATAQEPSTFGNSPPDERASGWLLVSHTALPVRGPSLAA